MSSPSIVRFYLQVGIVIVFIPFSLRISYICYSIIRLEHICVVLMKHTTSLTNTFLSCILLSTQGYSQTQAVRDNGPDCNCFLVSGTDPGYFQNHRFIDFRNINPGSGEDFTKPPALVDSSNTQGNESVTSSYFNSDTWNQDWFLPTGQTNHAGPVTSIDSAQNVFIFKDEDLGTTYLALRALRLDSFVSNCEIDTNISNIFYSSMRTRTRLIPAITNSTAPQPYLDLNITSIDGLNISHPVAPGTVLGFFTYQSDTSESDIEILTSDPISDIRYSNQPDYNITTDQAVPGASTDLTLQNNIDWTDWHDHRIDWYEGISRWYVDGQLMLEKTINVPATPAQLILNLWSDGGTWSNNMTVDTQVVAGFQWIEMVYNISGGNGGSEQCTAGCNVDNVKTQGTPEKAFSNAAASISHSVGLLLIMPLAVAWLWIVLV